MRREIASWIFERRSMRDSPAILSSGWKDATELLEFLLTLYDFLTRRGLEREGSWEADWIVPADCTFIQLRFDSSAAGRIVESA